MYFTLKAKVMRNSSFEGGTRSALCLASNVSAVELLITSIPSLTLYEWDEVGMNLATEIAILLSGDSI